MVRRIKLTERKPLSIRIVCFGTIRYYWVDSESSLKAAFYELLKAFTLFSEACFHKNSAGEYQKRRSIFQNGRWLWINDIFTKFCEWASQEKKVNFQMETKWKYVFLCYPFWEIQLIVYFSEATKIVMERKTYKLYFRKT